MQKRRPWIIVSAAVVFIALLAIMGWAWVPSGSPARCTGASNAAWIDVAWSSTPINAEAVTALANDAQDRGITYLFPYTSYLTRDGSFSPSYTYTHDFVGAVHAANPSLRVLAWVGLPLVSLPTFGVHGWVDLSDPATRAFIVSFISSQVESAGFDGVHLNAETVPNNDPNFLRLLEEVRQALGPNKLISIAASHWVPDIVSVVPLLRDLRWTGAYYRQVAERVDQIVTMSYDSMAFAPGLYRFWVREQVKGITASLAGIDVETLVGISVSREKTNTHQPAVENLQNGLAGVCGDASGQQADGIAFYADWEFAVADRDVWRAWQPDRR